jgi:two-component system, NarL family, response regulator DevR
MNEPLSQTVSPIRISLMCESPIVYKTLGPRLSADRSLQVVGWHDCLIELVPEVLALQPHVVILGISRITHFNMLICKTLRQTAPGVRIVILPSYVDTPEDSQKALDCGADVVIEKNIDTPALVEHIHTLVS